MNFSILPLPFFTRQLKRLVKKYPSLKQEFADLIAKLQTNPELGTSLGNDCYKVRVAVASKGKGKSGGARVITLVVRKVETIYLLSIYDKSEQEDIAENELKALIQAAIK
jgi:hypothetical protein